MAGKTNLLEPSDWEKRWREREVIATATLMAAGIVIAILLGIGQRNIATSQREIAEMTAQTAQNEAVASLIIALGHESARVRKLAAVALAPFGEVTIPPLMLALGDDNKETRSIAVAALVHVYHMHETPRVINEVKRKFVIEGSQNVIEACVLILVQIEKFDELVTIVIETGWPRSRFVIDVLEREKQYELLNTFLEIKDLSAIDRMYVVNAMGKIAVAVGKPVVQYLIKFSTKVDLNEDLRIKLITTLGRIIEKHRGDRSCDSLIKSSLLDSLKHESDRVRGSAVRALERLCSLNEVREALEKVSKEDKAKLVKDMARRVLESKNCKKP